MSDCLRIISESAAKVGGGQYVKARLFDVIFQKPKDSRTGEQIVADTIKKAGIKVIK